MAPVADIELSGEQLKDLQNGLLAAFPNHSAFRQLTEFRLKVDLATIVIGENLTEIAFELILWARAHGCLRELIGGARAENQGNPHLKDFADRLGIQPLVFTEPPSPAEANRGLTALGDLMAARNVREAVRAFETEFQDAVEQIGVLAVFKDVHDQLHTLQFRCYDGLARQIPRFPADAIAREIVEEHVITLEETIAKLDAITAHRVFANARPAWIDDLRAARDHIRAALDIGSAQRLSAAVRVIDRVLAVQPTRINARLTDAARAVRLRDVVADLEQVHGRLAGSHLDAAKMTDFETGINGLRKLDLALSQLVSEHDRWQELDVELRLEKNAYLANSEGFVVSWPQLRSRLLPLCGGADAWAVRLTAECGKLDAALAAGDPAGQRSTFFQVHNLGATRFYQVDISLQRLCGSLREIGLPLTELLRRLQ